jgi:hypothetical protein
VVPDPTNDTPGPNLQYDPGAIFQDDGPINPGFVHESVRTLMRALPLDDESESRASFYRRMQSALTALSVLRPGDEIEIMLAVQALSAYYAAAACWRIGMNLRRPHGDSTRHITTTAAARTFDTLLKALERRQVRPLTLAERPRPRYWDPSDPAEFVLAIERNCRIDDPDPDPDSDPDGDPIAWTRDSLAAAEQLAVADRELQEAEGLDLAHTDCILPGGGIIVPEHPIPQQEAYIARRLGLSYKRQYAENLRRGIDQYPPIRPIRPGDFIA